MFFNETVFARQAQESPIGTTFAVCTHRRWPFLRHRLSLCLETRLIRETASAAF